MLSAFVLNGLTLILASRRQWRYLGILLGGACLFAALRSFESGLGFSSLSLLAEGVACSLALAICLRKGVGTPGVYVWALLPALLPALSAVLVPSYRLAVEKQFTTSLQGYGQWLNSGSTKAAGATPANIAAVNWIVTLFPACWLLESFLRVWLVRMFLGKWYPGKVPVLKLSSFRAFRTGDAFLWAVVAGLTAEILGGEIIRPIGHNILLFAGIMYLIQGFAILQEFLVVYRVSPILRAGLYLLIFVTQVPLLTLAAVGFVDTWLEFRGRFKKPALQE